MPRPPTWLVLISALVAVAAGALIIVNLLRRPLVEVPPADAPATAEPAAGAPPLAVTPVPATPASAAEASLDAGTAPAAPPPPPDDIPGWEAALVEARSIADEAALGLLIAGAPSAISAERVAALEREHVAGLFAASPGDPDDAVVASGRLRTWTPPAREDQDRGSMAVLHGRPETVLCLDLRGVLLQSVAGAPWQARPALPERGSGSRLVTSPAQPGWILVVGRVGAAEAAHAGLCSEDGGTTWRRLPWPAGLPAERRDGYRLHLLGGRLIMLDCPDGQGGREAWRHDGRAWARIGAATQVEPLAMQGGGAILALGPEKRGRPTLLGVAAADDLTLRDLGWNASQVRWPVAEEPDLVLGDDAMLHADRGRLIRVDRRLHQVGDLGRPETRDGGQITAMAQDPAKPERFWALLWHGGLWRSDDGGASWRRGRGALADLPSTTCAIVPGQDLRIAGAEWSLQDDESGTCFGGERIAPVRSPALLTALAAAERRPRRGGWPAEPAPGRELQLLLAEFAQLEPLALPGGEFATRLVTAVRAEPPATMGDRLARARLLRRMAGDGLEYEGGRGPDEPFRASRVDAAWLAARLSEPALAADAQEHPEFLVAQLDACAWVARCGPVLRPSQVVVVMRRGQRLAAWLQARWGGERRARQAVAGFETALASGIGHGGVLLREAFTTAFGLRRDEAPRHLLILADLVAAQPADASARRRLAEAIGDLDGWQDALRGQLPPGVGEAWLAAARALASGPVHPAEQPCIAIAAWRALRHAPAASDDRVVPDIAALVKPADPTVRYSRRGYLHVRAASQAYDAIDKRWRAAAPADRAAWLARFAAVRAVMAALDAGYDGMQSRNPDDAKAACANHLAWTLLTASDRAVHDPAAALALARQAVQTVPLAGYLDTLALAQARTDDRAGAVASQEAAIAAIAPRASAAWRRAFAQRLELYRELQADPARPLPEELFIDAAPPAKPAPAAPATPAGGF